MPLMPTCGSAGLVVVFALAASARIVVNAKVIRSIW